jgi:hypothetical protein
MRRRFQFSLRALLGLAAAVCVVLGGHHLLVKYGQYVVAKPAGIGEPISIDGQLVWLCGPRLLYVELVSEPRLDRLVRNIYVLKRSWGCLYRLKTTIDGISHAGHHEILLRMQPSTIGVRGAATISER